MRIACLTMAHNEPVFLPIWARYYSATLGPENLVVLNHGTDDGSLDCLPRAASVVNIPRTAFDEYPRTALVNNTKSGLLQYYDAVIYTDCDEIIVPDPILYPLGIKQYCKETKETVVAPVGLNLFQAMDREPQIQLASPVLQQRRYCEFASALAKPCIVKEDVIWSPGFHYASKMPHYASDIYMFHLKSIDRELSLAKLSYTRAMPWGDSNIQKGVGRHQRSTDEEHIQLFFERPLRNLLRAGEGDFDFTSEMTQIATATKKDGSYFRHQPFGGKVARIPDRFVGTF
jgi:hypothetical protein